MKRTKTYIKILSEKKNTLRDGKNVFNKQNKLTIFTNVKISVSVGNDNTDSKLSYFNLNIEILRDEINFTIYFSITNISSSNRSAFIDH